MSKNKIAKDLQSAEEVLNEMGYDKNAKQSTKAAFIKYLFKQAYGVNVEPPVIYQTKESEQLSFNIELSSDEPEAS